MNYIEPNLPLYASNDNRSLSHEFIAFALLSLPCLSAPMVEYLSSSLPNLSVEKIVILAKNHRTACCVYDNLVKHFSSLVSADKIEDLRRLKDNNVVRSVTQLQTCSKLMTQLKTANVKAKILKGVPLAFRLYGDIAKRFNHDIDIVVTRQDLSKSVNVLSANGFFANDYDGLSDIQKEHFFKANKDISFRNASGQLIEMHLRLTGQPLSYTDNYLTALFNDNWTEQLKSLECLYLCWHSADGLFHRIKWLVDVAILFQSMSSSEQEATIALAMDHNAMRMLSVPLVLTNKLFGTELPTQIVDFHGSDRASHHIVNATLSIYNDHERHASFKANVTRVIMQTLMYTNTKDKITFLKHKFTATIKDYVTFPRIPKQLYFLYYALRPVRILTTRLLGKNTVFSNNHYR